MSGAQCVLKPRVHCPGMHQITETQLFDAPLTLKQRMLYDVEYQLIVDVDKAIHGVIYYFEFVGGHSCNCFGQI
jgi:hypothetical protein